MEELTLTLALFSWTKIETKGMHDLNFGQVDVLGMRMELLAV